MITELNPALFTRDNWNINNLPSMRRFKFFGGFFIANVRYHPEAVPLNAIHAFVALVTDPVLLLWIRSHVVWLHREVYYYTIRSV